MTEEERKKYVTDLVTELYVHKDLDDMSWEQCKIAAEIVIRRAYNLTGVNYKSVINEIKNL